MTSSSILNGTTQFSYMLCSIFVFIKSMGKYQIKEILNYPSISIFVSFFQSFSVTSFIFTRKQLVIKSSLGTGQRWQNTTQNQFQSESMAQAL